MPLKFSPISLEKQDAYRDHFARCGALASDYSFINLWGWAEEYGLMWAWADDLVWLKQTRPQAVYWAPIGAWDTVDWANLLETRFPQAAVFIRVPEDLGRRWEMFLAGRAMVTESRDQWDYLYQREALAHLKGKLFHKKKNLVNQFLKAYPEFSYVPLDPAIIHQALELQGTWCTWRDCESSDILTAENRVIEKVLNGWDSLTGIAGGALMVAGKMAAYTVAEPLGSGNLVIHFEKGDPSYKGVYQAINQQFVRHAGEAFHTINREQDLGDEGLRKAKQSYHPSGFLKKCCVALSSQP